MSRLRFLSAKNKARERKTKSIACTAHCWSVLDPLGETKSQQSTDLTINPDSLYYAFKVDMSGQFLTTPITRWASAL